MWGPSDDWVPMNFCLRLVHMELPTSHQIRFRFTYPGTDHCRGFSSWISTWISCDSLYLPICLSYLGGQQFSLWPQFSELRIVVDFFFFFFKFIYFFKWEREGQREGERENPKKAPRCQHRAQCWTRSHKSWDQDLSWNQELVTWLTEPPRCP